MTITKITTWAALLTLAAPLAVQAKPTTYTVDLKQSELVVILRKGGVAARLGHDHVVAATRFTGSVIYDPAAPTKTVVSIDVETDSLEADDPKLLKKHKVKSGVSASDIKTIHKNLRSKEQLWVKKYPKLTFRSRKLVQFKQGGKLRTYVQGHLTIRGKTKLVSCLLNLEVKQGKLRARCVFTIRQSDFGYQPFSAMMGAVKVKDAAQIKVDITAVVKKPKPKTKKPI